YVDFFFSSRRRHTRFSRDWSSDVCSSDLEKAKAAEKLGEEIRDALGKAETVEELRAVWKKYAKQLTDQQKEAIKTRVAKLEEERSEERRVGKECRAR